MLFGKRDKKNKKQVLYQKFLSDQKKQLENELEKQREEERQRVAEQKSSEKKHLEVLKQQEKENQKEKQKEKRNKKDVSTEKKKPAKTKGFNFTGKISISIMTLSESDNSGCRHVALTIAKYMNSIEKSVCIVNYGQVIEQSICTIYNSKLELRQDYDRYDCIIYLVGNNSCGSSEDFIFSNYKLVMCLDQEEYKRRLYSFIQKFDQEAKFYYIFNFVSPKKVKSIHALMEDYYHCCLPLYSLDDNISIYNVANLIFEQ